MNYLATTISTDTYVNIMDQYYPTWKVNREDKYAEIDRRVFPRELCEAFAYARKAGLWRFDTR
jgi:putative pyruvate formate lyase activating enzyme